jgi:hypothetical protein
MNTQGKAFPEMKHEVDLCVVGGGMAGLAAALAAARHGAKTVLMHDRPVLGGNASSECRVHVTGADRGGGIPHVRETGIVEELRLDNIRRNPNKCFSIWDTVLHEKTMAEDNLTLLLNCSCCGADMEGDRIASVSGWQLTTQTRHVVHAACFADCSGDAVLAPPTGAEVRVGREARAEFGESHAPEQADRRTMGMTCMFQSRPYDTPQPFEPPAWAHRFDSCDDLPYGANGHRWWEQGYWWIEMGGEYDSIHDTEMLRDELLKITYGVWDHIKNRCQHRDRAQNWALEWVQFLPAKRESRRYVGDHMLSQGDVESEGRFDDVAAYGGWPMDDHHPAGFWSVKVPAPATIFYDTPSPFGIPYRCLYSRNVPNLMFAGRNASCTHAAMSATRVMATCAVMGQAVGTAAAMALRLGTDPRGITPRIRELQQLLLRDDAYLPGVPQAFSGLTTGAELRASRGDPSPVRDGIARQVGDQPHAWTHAPGDWAAYAFGKPCRVRDVTLVFDSALERDIQMHVGHSEKWPFAVPEVMPRIFRVEGLSGGTWGPVARVDDNHQRLVRVGVGRELEGIRYTLEKTWGAPETRLYAFYAE